MAKLSWTNPICWDCWDERNPDRFPVRVLDHDEETCAFCGESTIAGIFVRHDPTQLPYPATEDD